MAETGLYQVILDSLDENNPKVCIATSNYPPYPENTLDFRGGISEEFTEIVDKLNKSNIATFVISLSLFGSSPEHWQVKRVNKYVPYTTSKFRQLMYPFYEFFNPIVFLRIFSILRKEKPSVFVIGETYQMSTAPHIACMLLGIKRIVCFDWMCPSYPKAHACSIIQRITGCGDCISPSSNIFVKSIIGIFSSIMFLIKRKLWNKAYKITIQSQYHRQLFKEWGLDETKFEMAPPVSTIHEDESYTANLLNLKGNAIAICYIGRLTTEKGFDMLLDAFEICRSNSDQNMKLFVAGSGPLQNQSEGVNYLGWVEKDRLGSIYKIADVIVVPTIVPEVHPAVVEDALKYDKKIIAFKVGALEEMIGENGVLIEDINTKNLASAICTVIEKIVK